ncbi:MAG: hypothetical protein K1Y01_20225 [Vicinamibacteria bacterium]|nr:hypothetical protein [Vicinamibacteria bacterium]
MTSPSASSPSHTLGYDPLYRLTRADRTNPGATPPNQWTWSYDAVGNRTSAQKDNEATTSTHNEKNQLLQTSGGGKMLWRGTLSEPGTATFSAASASINGQPARMLAGNVFEATLDLPAGANTVTIQAQDGSGNVSSKSYTVNVLGSPATYTYDANGNLATKTEGADAWVYTWNALNQLIAVTKNGVTQATYAYDPAGRRVQRSASVTTTWTYDDEDVIRQAAGPVVSLVLHGPGVDETLATEAQGITTFLQVDGLGSIVRHTSTSGAVAQSVGYDAWGVATSTAPDTYGFTGREWDADVALYYLRARWYDPRSGGFLGPDPSMTPGLPGHYLYVGANPTGFRDPSGLKREATWIDPPGIKDFSATYQGPIYPGEYWSLFPPQVGLYGEWWLFKGNVSGTVKCTDTDKCAGDQTKIKSVKLPIWKTIGIGVGMTMYPYIHYMKRGKHIIDAFQEAYDAYYNYWVQIAKNMLEDPMTWCRVLGGFN